MQRFFIFISLFFTFFIWCIVTVQASSLQGNHVQGLAKEQSYIFKPQYKAKYSVRHPNSVVFLVTDAIKTRQKPYMGKMNQSNHIWPKALYKMMQTSHEDTIYTFKSFIYKLVAF